MALALRLTASVALASAAQAVPQKLIIDTDIGGGGCMDVDDVAAVALGHALMDNGEAELVAVVVNTSPVKCPGVISVLNHYYSRDDIPIGSYKGADLQVSNPNSYVDDLVDNWDSPIKESSQVPDSVEVYRKVLAASPDNSVAISSIGLMTNLRALLQSKGDQYSSLDGPELVAQKVKLLAAMAGAFPSGGECNMMGGGGQDHAVGSAASAYVYSNWPSSVKIIFSGFEVGVQVMTGGPLKDCQPSTSPIRQAFADAVGSGNARCSWDPLTTVVAVRGAASMGCSECTNCDGKNEVDGSSGRNEWVDGPWANQTYLLLHNAGQAADAMNDLLCQGPKTPPPTPAPPSPAPTPPGAIQLRTEATSGAEPATTRFGGGDYSMAWDGDVRTFFDFSSADGGWTQAQLSSPGSLSQIQYYPRSGFLDRHVGGRFVGITLSGNEVLLATISSSPSSSWNGISVHSSDIVTAVKYEAPAGAYGNIAEIALYGSQLPGPTPTPSPPSALCAVKATAEDGAGPAMSGFGGGDYAMAWDGDVATFYDFSSANGGWTRASLESPSALTQIRYYPRSEFLSRHIGGRFVGIASAGHEVVLAQVSSMPSNDWNFLSITAAETFTSVKYAAPDGGYGNIAEIELYTSCVGALV